MELYLFMKSILFQDWLDTLQYLRVVIKDPVIQLLVIFSLVERINYPLMTPVEWTNR